MGPFIKKYLLLLFYSPLLSYFFTEYIGYSHYHGIFYFWVITIILGFIWIISNLRHPINLPLYLKFILSYLLYLLLWDIFNGNIERRGIIIYLLNNRILASFFILLIIENLSFSKSFIKKAIVMIKITIVLSCIASIAQILYDPLFLSNTSLNSPDDSANSIYLIRRLSIFAYLDPISPGLVLMPLTSILLGYNLSIKKSSKRPIIFLTMAGIVALGTNTRWVLGAFLIVLAQAFFLEKKIFALSTFKQIIGFSVIILLILIVFTNVFHYDIDQFYSKRLFAEGSTQNTTRYLAYEIFLKNFPKHYLFGTGQHLTKTIMQDLQGRSSQIHIGYLSHLVSYGLIGSLLLFMSWYLLAKRLLRSAQLTGFYGSFFGFLIFLWANVTLVYYSIFSYGLIFCFIFNKYNYDLSKSNYQEPLKNCIN